MVWLFTTIVYLNTIMAVAAFVFAFILLKRGRNPIYFNFGMAILFLALWMLITLLDFFRFTPLSSTFHLLLEFAAGIWILHYFLIFTYNFPIVRPDNKLKILFFYITTTVVFVTIFIPNLYVTSSFIDFPFRYSEVNATGLSIFIIYFIILAIVAFVNLFQNYERSDGLHRTQLKKIMAGTAIAIVANIIFSLVN